MPTKDVDLVKERLDIVEVLRSYLSLLPAGKNFKALCPFHQEKTPSFIVSPERKTWHCFGCGEGGDVISFVMKHEHLEFPEALRFLAERAGVEIRSLNPQAEREFGILYDLHAAAADFYRDALSRSEEARRYLASRTITPETVKVFGIGYAPGASSDRPEGSASVPHSSSASIPRTGEALTLHLLEKKFSIDDIVRSGLALRTASGLHRDRFQNRIMFPIENHVGKVVAFTGRLLPDASLAPSGAGISAEAPKYLNSPETPIFNKSKVLFGLSKTKSEIAKSRSVVLVEGQMDLILAWQSGIKNIVAVSGTALSRTHIERLRRLADTISISFDNDAAGQKALERGIDLFSQFDFHLKAINLGPYKDPGEACEREPAYLEAAARDARPAYEQFIEGLFRGVERMDLPGVKRAVRVVLEKILRLPSAAERDAWLKELARHAGISETSLLGELANLPASDERASETELASVSRAPERIDMIAARLLALAFTRTEFFDTVKSIENLLPEPHRRIVEHPESAEAGLLELHASVLAGADQKEVSEEFNELIRQLKIERAKAAQAAMKERIRSAEQRSDEREATAAKQEFDSISRQLNELKSSR